MGTEIQRQNQRGKTTKRTNLEHAPNMETKLEERLTLRTSRFGPFFKLRCSVGRICTHLRRRTRLLINRPITSSLFFFIPLLRILLLVPPVVQILVIRILTVTLLGRFRESFPPSRLVEPVVFGGFTPVFAAPSLSRPSSRPRFLCNTHTKGEKSELGV